MFTSSREFPSMPTGYNIMLQKCGGKISTQKLVTGCDLTSREKGSGECFTANEPRLSGTQVV